MHLPEPARAHDLRQGTGIVPVGLVRHRLHCCIRLTRLDADRWQALSTQPVVKPGRQRACLQPNALQRQIKPARVVSVGGSTTEIVYALGAGGSLVASTTYTSP